MLLLISIFRTLFSPYILCSALTRMLFSSVRELRHLVSFAPVVSLINSCAFELIYPFLFFRCQFFFCLANILLWLFCFLLGDVSSLFNSSFSFENLLFSIFIS
ncbi:hypothetical protein V8G54_032001 [Vigna mungo]|uniref:Uncharacterized protein n=1 Tax=Vigna mungo TaxID=3915 RepID=A0AAQ3REZ5_VIGMU